jgi:signal transduction histidine kinase
VSQHDRHVVARWLHGLSLSTRLSLFVALIVTGVATSVAYLEVHSLERNIDRALADAARLAAHSAADTVASGSQPPDTLDLRDTLHDLVEADPVLDAISVFETDPTGRPHVLISTSTEERAEVLDLAARAIMTQLPADDRTDTVVMVALPVPHLEHYAVAATVGLESLLQARGQAAGIALGFALPTIALMTLLVHLTVRQLLGQPLASILRTMTETAAGQSHARTIVTRRDELGTIAQGLNEMLDQLERANHSLHERIEEATSDLALRNAQLAANQHQLLAARESLARAERVAALGQVAANLAHQAGTPLNLVSGYVQMIRDDPRTDERTRSRLQTVDLQIQQVTRVLRTMLDHAKPSAGFASVALADIIGRVKDIAQPRLSRANIQLRIAIADGLPLIRADATPLEMALLNLVTNALDAMPDGGVLSMTATPTAHGLRLEIADSGPGIAPAVVDRLFDPWVTTKPAGQGTGLGLGIVRDVLRAHGGSIVVSSTSNGAVFTIELPAAAQAGSRS